MTTAAPPCAPVTPSPGPLRRESQQTQCAYIGGWPSAKAVGPAYPMSIHWCWRGGRRPPSEPPVSRAAPGAADGRGPSPRTPAPAPAPSSGAPLWSPASRRWTRPSSTWRRPSGSPPSGSGPTRSPAASGSGTSMPSSASRPARPPRADSWPSRRDASRRRRGLGATPGTVTRSEHKSGLRGRVSGGKGGVAPSPALRPKAEGGSRRQAVETQRGQRVPTTAATERHERKYAHKGVPTSAHPKAAPGTTPASLAGRSRAWPATPQRPAIPASCRRRLAGPPVGRRRGDPDRGGPGSRSSVPSVPSAAPPGPPRGPGARRPVRSKVVYVPGAAPFGSGFPAIQDRAAPSGSPFWKSLVTARIFIHLWRHASGPAGRVPAEAGVPSRTRREAEWSCDVRSAERCACRSGDRRSKPYASSTPVASGSPRCRSRRAPGWWG